LTLLALVLLACGIVGSARLINANEYRIVSDTGVDEQFFLDIGGLQQFVQIRGECTSNSVIVFVHGGPANPLPHLAYHFQRGLERDFTIVHWDQRSSGRTYFENLDVDQPDVSLDLILRDMDEIVDYVRERFATRQVIVVGHSWGTVVGGQYVQRHPEKVEAFIAVSQVVNVRQGVGITAREMLAGEQDGRTSRADASELTNLIEQLEMTEEYSPDLLHYFNRIPMLAHSNLPHEHQRSIPVTVWASASSPVINVTDLRWFLTIISAEEFERIQTSILQESFSYDARDRAAQFAVPVLFIVGDNDWLTPVELIEDYYVRVGAPHKELTILGGVGHNPLLEVPDQVHTAIVDFLE